jgi:hypothetical protein
MGKYGGFATRKPNNRPAATTEIGFAEMCWHGGGTVLVLWQDAPSFSLGYISLVGCGTPRALVSSL